MTETRYIGGSIYFIPVVEICHMLHGVLAIPLMCQYLRNPVKTDVMHFQVFHYFVRALGQLVRPCPQMFCFKTKIFIYQSKCISFLQLKYAVWLPRGARPERKAEIKKRGETAVMHFKKT